jgi:putative ABC transport system permease protein
LDDVSYVVIGVMPPSFENVVAPSADLWSLLQLDPALPTDGGEWGHWLHAVARLRATTTLDGARRDVDAIARTRVREFSRPPWSSMPRGMLLTSLQDDLTRDIKPSLYAIAGAVLLVLAIACGNVTNLLLARGARRRAEFGLRRALGARPFRLMRQLLAESLLLATLGGGLGLLVAEWTVSLLRELSPSTLPRAAAITVDGGAFMFALVLTTLIGVVVGFVPALDAFRSGDSVAPPDARAGTSRSTGGHYWTRRVLIVAETALALALLTAAGLLLRSVERLFSIPPGFNPSNVLTMQIEIASRARYRGDAAKHQYFSAVLDAVRHVPGVSAAALTSQLPLSGDDAELEVYNGKVEPIPNHLTADTDAYRYAVSVDYFDTLGIPLRRGRLFNDMDKPAATVRPVVISESFARRAFPNQDPIGRHVRFGGLGNRPWDVIVGVVGDVKQTSLAATRANAFYAKTDQWLWSDNPLWLVVRVRGGAAALAPAVKRAVWSIDKDQPIVRVMTMDERLAASDASRAFVLRLFDGFALTALLLAALGIYGVLSGSVTERTREIGVRAALGASPSQILALVLGQGLGLTAAGIIVGVASSVVANRALVTLLFGVTPFDPLTYAAVVGVVTAVSVMACALPAWRAARIDPATTLRTE